ncbi:MAG TPA: HAD-IIIC family phosphatase, partial [Alphaproteobacteria bacterium]
MRNEWHNLLWLPPPPADFAALCKVVVPADGDALRRLSGYQLNDLQLTRLARICVSFTAPPPGFESFRLAILGNGNSEFAAGALKASALRYGVWLETHIEGLGQTATAALDPANALYEFNPSAVLLSLTYHVLPAFTPGNNDALEALKGEVILIRDSLRQNGNIPLIVQTIPQAPVSIFGSIDRRTVGTVRQQVAAFNDWLFTTDMAVLDVAALAETAGLASWHNNGQWHWAKLPFAQNLLPLYADYVARFIGALRGRSRKCLVLDLDNTLWGGVIGDDGLEGIELGQGSPRGEAFLAIQQMALALRTRGIVLAVCSKNDDGNARLPFREHPEQLLREEHIAVFQANWNDKASNLEAIARALDLTPEALVFLDDNPAERDIVRRELPAVAVPEIPMDEPALWPMILSAAGYFESVAFTDADIDRVTQYASNAQRESLKVKSRDIGDYLKELG